MRNTEQRIQDALRGAEKLKRQHKQRQLQALLGGVSLCLVLFFATVVPSLVQEVGLGANTSEFAASIFLNNQSLPYIIIGIVSFVLGVAFTVLCMMVHRKGGTDQDDD